jgi:hypothetical protein
MNTERPIHLSTEQGTALCGVHETRHLSPVTSAVTCLECRAFIQLKALERSLTERRLAATIARLSNRRS